MADTFSVLSESDFSDDPGRARNCAVSTNGRYLAITSTAISPVIYKRVGAKFSKLPVPDVTFSGDASSAVPGIALSDEGNYLAVGSGVSPYLYIYSRSGDAFKKLLTPDVMPSYPVHGCSFLQNGLYLAVATGQNLSTGNTIIYKLVGEQFVHLITISPGGECTEAAFSSDGTYLAIAHFNAPRISIYKRSGDTFTKLPNPNTVPQNGAGGCSFSPDGNYLAVCIFNNNTPTEPQRLYIYKRNGDTFTKLPNPSGVPTTSLWGCSFSNQYLVATGYSSAVFLYKYSGGSFTKLTPPKATGSLHRCIVFQDMFIGICYTTTPVSGFTLYKRDGANIGGGSYIMLLDSDL